jgi:DNA-binding MarR family transcriptional regulator
MHRIIFGLKAAHLGAVGFAKGFLGIVPHMTPARYDLLYVIRMSGNIFGRSHALDQSELRRMLGLHASTVSKMIKRLVEIGWLAKNLGRRPRRTNSIHLTEAGFEALELARRIVEKRRTVRWWFDSKFRPLFHGWAAAHTAIYRFWHDVDHMAAAFDREINLLYPLPYILDD